MEFIRQDNSRDVGFWRAVGYGYNNFGVECVIDEVAAAKGVDPVAFRLELLSEQPRALQGHPGRRGRWPSGTAARDGRALGLAYSDAFGAHCAQVAEVSLNREGGEIRVHNVWCVVDPGVAIQPSTSRRRCSGAIVQRRQPRPVRADQHRRQRGSGGKFRYVSGDADVGDAADPCPGDTFSREQACAVSARSGFRRPDQRSQTPWRGSPAVCDLRHYPFLPEQVKAALNA